MLFFPIQPELQEHKTTMAHTAEKAFIPLDIAVLTVSDTRTPDTDTSGDLLVERLQQAGHRLADRALIADDIYRLRAQVSQWIADPEVQVVLMTGGTGFSHRDSTPEAITPLLDKQVEGFGELFRQVSWEEIGSSTIQSRAIAGLANGTLIFCLPGSTGACRTGWDRIISEQLDSRHRPCNFVDTLLRARDLRRELP
jgi:molybdenum cofactor biosynthesis protein B